MSNKMVKEREHPFEYLRRKEDDSAFPKEIVNNWYIARAFVLEKLKDVYFVPGANEHLHVIIEGDSPVMLAVARQVALSAHYINFVEYDALDRLVCKNRSVITLVSQKETSQLIAELNKEENFCNLLQFCKYTADGKTVNADSYIDLELNIVKSIEEVDGIRISEKEVSDFVNSKKEDDIYSIDTRKAVCAKKTYDFGALIDNLPYEDINGAERYNRALAAFSSRVLKKSFKPLIEDSWKSNLAQVKEGLSNLICADCFESREKSIEAQCSTDDRKLSEKERRALWEKNNHALSLSEHSRWIVEKLIFGYSPMNQAQRHEYQSLFKKQRKAYREQLKNNSAAPVHLDLCPYRDLRRIDPNNMKYDSFLMLAIPLILEKVR